jgi:hypothetical protein
VSTQTDKRPWLAALLAFLYPGLGHVYLREWLRALVWFFLVVTSSTLLVPDGAVPEGLSVEAFATAAAGIPPEAALALVSITFFSMVDAYWVAKRRNERAAVVEGTTCPHCGKDVDPDLDFCHWCTERVVPETETDDA